MHLLLVHLNAFEILRSYTNGAAAFTKAPSSALFILDKIYEQCPKCIHGMPFPGAFCMKVLTPIYLVFQLDYSLLPEDRSFFGPPRIREICRPLLNAWLNNIRVWNSETKGNHAKKATGVNSSKPINIS